MAEALPNRARKGAKGGSHATVVQFRSCGYARSGFDHAGVREEGEGPGLRQGGREDGRERRGKERRRDREGDEDQRQARPNVHGQDRRGEEEERGRGGGAGEVGRGGSMPPSAFALRVVRWRLAVNVARRR